MSKVTVIGAGNVGATCANVLVTNQVADEVVLLDIKEGVAEGKAMDIMQTASILGLNTRLRGVTNDYTATEGSDMVVITSGIPRKPGMTREELIGVNAKIVKSVMDNVLKHSPEAVILCISNPMDTMTYLIHKTSGLPKNRIIGMGGALDSSRFKCYLAKATGANINNVDGMVIGGHGDMLEGLEGESNLGHLVSSPDEMRKAVREEFKLGAKNIKLMSTGGVMSPNDRVDDTELTVEEMKVAVEEAHHKHMTVCAHAEGANGIHNAIVAGVDSIEHGAMIRDEDIQLMIKNGQYLTPTLIACWAIPEYGEGKIPQFMVDKARGFEKDYFTNIGKAAKAGVKFSMGTDAGTPFNDLTDTPHELVLMREIGCTVEQIMHACGPTAAQLLKIDADYGTLEPGKYADFLVLDADPIANVAAVSQKDKAVYKHGVRVH